MRVRMLKDLDIAFDGINVQKLKTGESHDIPERFAQNLLNKGFVAEDKAIDKPPETKIQTKTTTRKRKK